MSFVRYSTEFLPEASFADPTNVQMRFAAMMEADLPGFVVRAAGNDIEEVTARLQESVGADYPFGSREQNHAAFIFCDRSTDGLGLHVDSDPLRTKDQTRINVHLTTRGSVVASLFTPKPSTGKWGYYDWRKLSYSDSDNCIDDFAVIPVEHRAEIAPQDLLVFTSRRHAHAFRSTATPRWSAVNVFHVPNRT